MAFKLDFPEAVKHLYEREVFRFRHNLADVYPFGTPDLLSAMDRLDSNQVEVNQADVAENLRDDNSANAAIDPKTYLSTIACHQVWVGLLRVQNDAVYGPMVHTVLDALNQALGGDVKMKNKEGFIAITSPGGVTPYHLDPEHNLLFQIQGRKEFVAFDPADRDLVTDEMLEAFYRDTNSRKLPLSADQMATGTSIILNPGEGIHIPIMTPHYVRNLDDVSISVSISHYSEATDRRAALHRLNGRLRAFGLRPSPSGGRAEAMKLAAHTAWNFAKRAVS